MLRLKKITIFAEYKEVAFGITPKKNIQNLIYKR